MSRPRELLTDYARGAMEEPEALRLEDHLRGCPTCRAEIREVREGFVELVDGLPRQRPPVEAWSGILARIRRGRVRGSRRLAWGLAASLLLLFGAGFWGVRVVGEAALASREAATVARWLSRDDVDRVGLGIYPSGGYGSVLLLPDGRTLFVLDNAPPLGRSYQAWGYRETRSEPLSLGVFSRPVFEVSTTGFEAVGVSLEPRGGSPAPTHRLGSAELP